MPAYRGVSRAGDGNHGNNTESRSVAGLDGGEHRRARRDHIVDDDHSSSHWWRVSRDPHESPQTVVSRPAALARLVTDDETVDDRQIGGTGDVRSETITAGSKSGSGRRYGDCNHGTELADEFPKGCTESTNERVFPPMLCREYE